jgi:ankyrin repeat protein
VSPLCSGKCVSSTGAIYQRARLLISAVKEDVVDVKTDTKAIKMDTTQIKQDTSQIEGLVQQIGFLRLQLSAVSEDGGRKLHLQRFLDQSTSYAETVVDAIEDDESTSESLTEPGEILENSEIPVASGGPAYGSVNGDIQNESVQQGIAGSDTAFLRTYTPVNSQPQRLEMTSNDVEPEQIQNQDEASDTPSTSTSKPYTGFTLRHEATIARSARIRNSSNRKEVAKLNEALAIAVVGSRLLTRIRATDTDTSKWRGSASQIEALLDQGADVHYKDPRRNEDILEIEMRNPRPDVVKVLLRHGATIYAADAEYMLFRAAEENWTELAKVALASGASSDTRITGNARARIYFPSYLGDNTTALELASKRGNFEVVEMLCASGAKAVDAALRAAVGSGRRPKMVGTVKILLDTSASPNATNLVGSNALHLALRYGHLDVVKVLLEHGAVVDEKCYPATGNFRWSGGEVTKHEIGNLLKKYSDQQQITSLTEGKA